MSIALTEEHQELSRVARAFLDSNKAREQSRAELESPTDSLPSFWKEIAEFGWMGLHIDERHGGQGFGLPELSIVVEAMGFAMAPGPFMPTVLTAALIAEYGSETTCRAFLPSLADGSLIGAVGLGGDLTRDKNGRLHGSAGLILAADVARVWVVCVGDDVALISPDQSALCVEPQKNIDTSRRVVAVHSDGVEISNSNLLPGARRGLERLARTLAAAEAAGGARACTEMATAYAQERVQFGPTDRHIRSGQAPLRQHARCHRASHSGCLGGRHEPTSVTTRPSWRPRLQAASPCPPSSSVPSRTFRCTAESGTPGSTTRISICAVPSPSSRWIGPVDRAREDIVRLMSRGARTKAAVELPPEADAFRPEARAVVEAGHGTPQAGQAKSAQRQRLPRAPLAEALGPQRGAHRTTSSSRKNSRACVGPDLSISGWNTLTIAQHGSSEQVERYVPLSLEGKIEFCQLFSEPGAGIPTRPQCRPEGSRLTVAGASRDKRCGPATHISVATDSPPFEPAPTAPNMPESA